MDDVKISHTINKNDVPNSKGRKVLDYSKILKSVATLGPAEALVLEVPLKKKHRLNGIKNAIKKEFPNSKYKVTSRSDKKKGKMDIYVHLDS